MLDAHKHCDAVISRCFHLAEAPAAFRDPGAGPGYSIGPQGRSHGDSDVIEPLSFLLDKPLTPQVHEPATSDRDAAGSHGNHRCYRHSVDKRYKRVLGTVCRA